MNPYYVGEFFLLLKNNTAVFRVPLSYRGDLEDALAQHGITCTSLVSQRVGESKDAAIPEVLKKDRFWKQMMREAVGPTVGGVVSTVGAALVGGAMCNVM